MDQPTEQKLNEDKFLEILTAFRGDLAMLEIYRRELEITNISVLRLVLKSIFSVCKGSRWGEVIIQISDGKIINIRTHENQRVVEDGDLFEERR